MTGSRSVRRGASGIAVAAFSAVLLSATMLAVVPATTQAASPTPWATFYAHELATSTREETYKANLQAALEAEDVARAKTAARVLYNYAKREATWLTKHRPQPCYRAWWGYARNYWTQMREGSGDIVKALDRLDAAYITTAQVHFDRAEVYMAAMESHLPTC